jgi:hypothetical protein
MAKKQDIIEISTAFIPMGIYFAVEKHVDNHFSSKAKSICINCVFYMGYLGMLRHCFGSTAISGSNPCLGRLSRKSPVK